MSAIRVLHIVTYMGRGGLETMIMNYYRHIDRSKIQFDFLVHRDFEADYDREIKNLGGRIYYIPKLNPFSKTYVRALNEFFRNHREYKIVHCHLDCMAGVPLKYAKQNEVACRIAHAHSSNQTKDAKYLLKLIFKKNISQYANELFACGQAAGEWMFGKRKFYVLNNAIEVKKYCYHAETRQRIRLEWSIDESTLLIGHVGRFSAPKNHTFLLNILKKLLVKNTKVRLLLVGDGELRHTIEQRARERGLYEYVIFAGVCENVAEILQAMDVFVFPSIYEGLPVSVIEAQAAGLPCLISDKVPIECKKTSLVQQLSLESGAEEWAVEVIKVSKNVRVNTYQEIKEAGFDVETNASWLENFYLSLNF